MSTPVPIRTVDGSLQHMRLNFRNQIFHSFVQSFARDEDDSGLSVKVSLHGMERYRIGDRTHAITPGRYLVVNHHSQFQCRVQSVDTVEGMCFYIDPEAAAEVKATLTGGHGRMLESMGQVREEMQFTEKVFGLAESPLGDFLAGMLPVLRDPAQRQRIDFQQFFIHMAERLVQSQFQTNAFLDNLSNEKASTREELYRRISLARIHIDERFLQDLSLDELASVAMTSKYHFLRCFKEIYGCSPYQYVLHKRLQHAAGLLARKSHCLTEIAMETGFTDRRAFNKAFKKRYGVLPSAFREDTVGASLHV